MDSVTGKRQQKVRLTPEELEAANAAAETDEVASAETETSADANTLTATLVTYGNAANGNNGNSGNGNGNQDKPTGSDVKKTSTVVKQFVVDFSSETYKPLMEHEVNGLDYRYVYSDKARLSVVVQGIENGSASLLDDAGELHAYYHCDYLGTTDYLTSAVNSKVISWTSYSEWGEITHNAVLKCGQRELDLVKLYATHDFDAVLNMYYAKARFYDADNRRFTAVDPILDPSQYDLREYVTDSMQLIQYLYVKDNAVNRLDPYGLKTWGIGYGSEVALLLDASASVTYTLFGGGIGISKGASGSHSNAKTIFDLRGVSGKVTAGPFTVSMSADPGSNVIEVSGPLELLKSLTSSEILNIGAGAISALGQLPIMSGSMVRTRVIDLTGFFRSVQDFFEKLECSQRVQNLIKGLI